MVMINTTISEMNSILRKKLLRKDYEEVCLRYGIDLSGSGEYLNFEMSSDRMELISKYSVGFLLGQLLSVNVHRYETVTAKRADITINETHRPFVNLLHVKLNGKAGDVMDELITIQDKFDKTIGRDRRVAAIGMFDYAKLKFPLKYLEIDGKDVSFVPLNYSDKKTYKEILDETDKGRQYGHLLGSKPTAWVQKGGDIFALPPIVNADFSSLSSDSKTILIDVTGTDKDVVNALTKALIFNMQFFGEVSVLKPDYSSKRIETGIDFKQVPLFLKEKGIKDVLGVEISSGDIKSTLSRLGYQVSTVNGGLYATPPFYRGDVIHQVDVIDDIMRVYGLDKIKPDFSRKYTPGATLPGSQIIEIIRDTLVGMGYQELDLNIMTNESYQFNKTGINASDYASFVDTKNADATMVRINITPEALHFVSNNLHKKFPQKVFDIGFIVSKANTDVNFANEERLCLLSCGADSNMSEMIVALEKVIHEAVGDKGMRLEDSGDMEGFSKTVIKGRAGVVYYDGKKIGVLGEVHPRVLNEFGIELPASFAEIYLDKLLV
ncbi:MAG: phenylalanine--tRNA ligase subunit beta [Candidatus Parvarchaeota archaeon]|nr:phenylalanine--tRNA ligase subunit beta [Candidatus Parvarchaeota archaeon]